MGYYITADGIDDEIQFLNYKFDEFELDVEFNPIEGRNNGYIDWGSVVQYRTDGTWNVPYSNMVYINDIPYDYTTNAIPKNERFKLKYKFTVTQTISRFSLFGQAGWYHARGSVYNIKFSLDGEVFAHFDLTKGTFKDQTGNGNFPNLQQCRYSWARSYTDEDILVQDSFNRDDNDTSIGVADSGQTWEILQGAFGIDNNRAYPKEGSPAIAVIDSGQSNAIIEVKRSTLHLTYGGGMVFRLSDENNFFLFRWLNSVNGLELLKFVDNVATVIKSFTFSATVNTIYDFRVVLDGSRITCYIDNAPCFDLVDTFNLNATKHGIRRHNIIGTYEYFDDFKVTTLPVIPDEGYALKMDGVSEYLKTPQITFNEIIIEMKVRNKNAGTQMLIDIRGGYGFGYLQMEQDGRVIYGHTNMEIYINDSVTKSPQNTKTFNFDERVKLRLFIKDANPTDDINFFSSNSPSWFTKGEIYNIKIYNNSSLVAHYDFSKSTSRDLSGNENHAFLSGGTRTKEFILATYVPPAISNFPLVNITSVTNQKMSDEEGKNQAIINIQFDKDVQQYVAMLNGVDYNTGVLVHSGGATNANTDAQIIIDYDESLSEGSNRINIYGQALDGTWTTYNEEGGGSITIDSILGKTEYGTAKYGQ